MSEARSPRPARRRVLFLYNVPDWAIHNVGRDWAALLERTHEVALVRFGRHEREDPDAWDHVVWGYSTLRYSGRTLCASLAQRPFGWLRWRRTRSPRLAAVIQDPSELFPEVRDWPAASARTGHLARFARLAVTSNEMQQAMARLGFDTHKVSTRSLLPARAAEAIVPEPLRAFTRAQPYPRKNLPLFDAIGDRVRGRVERWDAILGRAVLPGPDYVRQVDGYNVYVCTSWQEGGPLPLMDAQRRGCVVLTTRVGQTDERVEHGVNGFFCDGVDDFAARIEELAADPARFHAMRQRARALAAVPDDVRVRAQLEAFLP